MELVDIDVVRSQIPQGSMQILPESFRVDRSGLGRYIDLIPHAIESFAQLLLTVRVEPRRIEKGHAMSICLVQKLYSLLSGDSLDGQGSKGVLLHRDPGTAQCHFYHLSRQLPSLFTAPIFRFHTSSRFRIPYPQDVFPQSGI